MKKYFITTFGCQMNESDSERIATIAEDLDYSLATSIEESDLIIINSCSIRQKAEDRVVGMGKKIAELKLQNPDIKVILTGCMAKRDARDHQVDKEELKNPKFSSEEKYHAYLKKVMQWLDFILPINEMHKLGKYLNLEIPVNIEEYLSVMPKSKKNFSQWIPISTGCNKFCTFCIVPFSRGREIYRPYAEIFAEIQNAISSGAKEIILLGQNVNSWRGISPSLLVKEVVSGKSKYIESSDPHRLLKHEMPENMLDFADLMDKIGNYADKYIDETGKHIWIKFTSAHPYDIDEKLIDVVNNHKSIAKQFHFAMQSGSDSVLRRMNRHYKIDDFIKKCELIRTKIDNVGISTDVIVGFCGETEDEFIQTKSVIENLKFDQAFISEYSNRKGTVAARVYKDDVPNDVKSNRKTELNFVLGEGNLERNKKMVGKDFTILVYKKSKSGFVGRTENGKDVILADNNLTIGEFVNAEITGYTNWSLSGKSKIKSLI